MQPSQQHVAPCVKEVERRLGTRGMRIVTAFWAGIPVEATQEAGVISSCPRAILATHLAMASYDTQGNGRHTTRKETVGIRHAGKR